VIFVCDACSTSKTRPPTLASGLCCGALSHGVPLVVAGEAQDKPEVAGRVEWSGVGINLRTARPDEAAIRSAVRRILSEGSFRDRARGIQTQIEEHAALGTIAGLVE
jgi:UDP:flavonoid glycosyltransferase YjiC (YdhE family)